MIEYIINIVKKNEDVIISSHDSESNMIYYKFKDKTIDVIIKIPESTNNLRKTKKISIIDKDKVNLRKLKNAIKPN
jgi:hypothetical protein